MCGNERSFDHGKSAVIMTGTSRLQLPLPRLWPCRSRARGRPRDGGAARRRELGQAAGEIAQMQVQLIERKADGKDALDCIVR